MFFLVQRCTVYIKKCFCKHDRERNLLRYYSSKVYQGKRTMLVRVLPWSVPLLLSHGASACPGFFDGPDGPRSVNDPVMETWISTGPMIVLALSCACWLLMTMYSVQRLGGPMSAVKAFWRHGIVEPPSGFHAGSYCAELFCSTQRQRPCSLRRYANHEIFSHPKGRYRYRRFKSAKPISSFDVIQRGNFVVILPTATDFELFALLLKFFVKCNALLVRWRWQTGRAFPL